jgi:3-mercaptopyruvate sulfurtransferase SseA
MICSPNQTNDRANYFDQRQVNSMNLISREELHSKLARGERFELLMTLSDRHFTAKRIPRSRHFDDLAEALDKLDPAQEVVVYCGDVYCAASIRAYYFLSGHGFARVRRYAGGIADWEAAGYRLESGPDRVPEPAPSQRRPARRASRTRAALELCLPR